MKITRVQNKSLVIGALIAMLMFQLPVQAYVTKEANSQLTQLLSDASHEAFELSSDANEMQALVLNDANWVTHALMLAKVKGHVDNMALITEKLSKTEKSGSELQKEAVDQMLPLVKELSANTTAAISYLNQNKTRPISDPYTQYLKKNAETARQLSSMISSLVDYENSMTEIEKLRSKLAVPEN
jgi:hypothetical protein